MDAPSLDVWYICDLTLCNFDCSYCASGVPERGGGRSRTSMWRRDDSPERFRKITRWIAALPYRVGLRLQTIGEPFVSEELLEEAARLTRSPNLRFVELVTNGSLLARRLPTMLDRYEADPARLSLWVTYHHGQISPEALLENLLAAHQHGAFVVLNALAFPDTLDPVKAMIERAAALGIRTNLDLGQNLNGVYGEAPFFPVITLRNKAQQRFVAEHAALARVSLAAAFDPHDRPCSAGHDYVYVRSNGDVFPCLGYSRYLARPPLGNALAEPAFVPPVAAGARSPCMLERGCICKEDYLHLEIARPGPDREHSLAYWPAAQQAARDESVSDLLEVLEGLNPRLRRLLR